MKISKQFAFTAALSIVSLLPFPASAKEKTTKIIVACVLFAVVSVTGCGQNWNETAVKVIPETEISSLTESTITETETEITTEVTTEVTTTMMSDAKAEDFLGEWKCGTITLFISHIDGSHYGGFVITYENPPNTDVFDEWEYDLQYQDGKMICNGDGRRYHFDMNTAAPYSKWIYLNGRAEFTLTSEGLLWNDLTEHFGDGMVFRYSETQPIL